MMRLFVWMVAAALVVAMTSCGGGSSAPPPPPPPPDYDFLTGTAQQAVTFDFRGSLPTGATLVTTEGIRLVVQPGTVVRTRRGTRLLGNATLGVDDSGGTGALPSPSALNGVVRTWVRLGANLVDAVFDPPAMIELPLGDWSLPGGWMIGTNVQNRACVLGPDPSNLAGPGNEGDPVSLGVVDINHLGLEQVPVEQAGPIGFRFVSHPPGTTLQAIVFSTSVVSFPVPGAPGAEWPKVYAWKLVNPDTADIVAIGTIAGGMGNGESQTVSYSGNTYTATLVSDGGGRRLEITSNVNNVFRVELQLCDQNGTGSQADGTASGGSAGEADTGGSYAGAIEITILGWGGGKEELKVWEEIESHLGSGQSATQDRFAKTGPDSYASSGRVFGHSDSTQTLAGSLPAGWDVQAGNRTITIRIPCPPQTTGVSQTTSLGVSMRSSIDYTELFPVPLGIAPLAGVMTSNGEAMAVASVDRVDLVDLTVPISQDVNVPGLTSAIDLGPFDETVYLATSTGTFAALDLETGAEIWSIATLPVTTIDSLVVAPDGAYAYACLPLTGEVLEVDLVNRAVGRTFPVPGANALDIAFSRHELAVTSGTDGGVHVVDLVAGTVGPIIPTGAVPSDVVFADDDAYLLVANTASVEVTLIDALTSTPMTNLNVGPGPVSVTAGRTELGDPYGIAVTLGDPFAMPLPIEPSIAVFPVTDVLPITVDSYPLTDEPAFVVVNGR